MNDAARHLALLTRTTEVVNSSLDLQEVLEAIAHEVAAALGTDACFVYLYDERADELVLRATHGTGIEDATSAPRMRSGEGITGVAAAERAPIMIPERAHLDPRFKAFPNLREDQYESILAVPILARDVLEGALNVRTREPRAFTEAEIGLLTSIASQVGQSIEHAKLYAQARRRVEELEALARISEAVSESLYLEESLEAIVRTTVESLQATGAAVVLEDGRIAWPEGRSGAHAVRLPLRWRGRAIGELVVDRDTPFSADDRQLLDAIANQAAVALEHGRMALRGVLAQEIHHRVKNNLQTVASLLRLQARGRRRRSAEGARRLGQPDPRDRRRPRGADGAPRGRRRPRRASRPTAGDARPGPCRREGRDRRPGARRARRATRDVSRSRLLGALLERSRARRRPDLALLWGATGATSFSRSPTTARACGTRPTEPGSPSSARSSATSSAGSLELTAEGGLRVDVPRGGSRPEGGTTCGS